MKKPMTAPMPAASHLAVVGGTAATAAMQIGTQDPGVAGFSYIIADDHHSVTLAVSLMLADQLGVAESRFSTANTSAALLAACSEQASTPRIVVLDLVMPGSLKRVSLVRAILATNPALKVLVYTAEESAFLARAVMQAGAAGYVAKTSPTAELIDALNGVAKGQTYTDSHIDLDSLSKHAWSTLTDSERAVLVAFCRGSKAHDIVESTGRSYSTVTTHKYNGLNKLGLRDGNDLLPYIYENGLLHELDD
ncbi:response regulator [Xanthomonas phaseoli]|uniref:response regulator n=2 Tax=Xanthomonas phaseoli TaxID=1985254 RepID=UPI001FD00E2A|nr:response regulator transcription factor [Xanthomonas phaseoli]